MTDTEMTTITLHPGDKYRTDGVVDTTKRLAWAELSDEEARRVRSANGWMGPNTHTSDEILADAVRLGAPETVLYLAEYQENEPGYSYLGLQRSLPT